MGASSVGKSTYIKSILEPKINKNVIPIIMASELTNINSNWKNQNCIVHYNLFRPFKNNSNNIGNSLFSDSVLFELLQVSEKLDVCVLVAPLSEIKKRILLRNQIEPLFGKSGKYPAAKIFSLICQIDLSKLYLDYFNLLTKHKIKYDIIDTTNTNYFQIDNPSQAIKIIENKIFTGRN